MVWGILCKLWCEPDSTKMLEKYYEPVQELAVGFFLSLFCIQYNDFVSAWVAGIATSFLKYVFNIMKPAN